MCLCRCCNFVLVYFSVCSRAASELLPDAPVSPSFAPLTPADASPLVSCFSNALLDCLTSTFISSSLNRRFLSSATDVRRSPDSAFESALSKAGRLGFFPNNRDQKEVLEAGAIAAVSSHSANSEKVLIKTLSSTSG